MTETTYQRPLAVGEMIDVFRIERVLGAGGFGITYLATDTTLNCQVALKEYFPQNAWREQHSRVVRTNEGDSTQSFQVGLDRFHKEGQALALFSHPNIVRVRRLLVANNTAYLVMDYEHGETLESYLQRLGRPLTYQEAETIFNPLLDGLRAIHERNLLHLDIKPANIFLRGDGIPVLIDFGGARHLLGQASRMVSFLVASDGYAPNEQYSGHQLQPHTDIYAVGATLYYAITGRVPADSPIRANAVIDGQPDPLLPVSHLVSHGAFPANFLQVLDAALNMRAASRPQSVREFQQRLFAPPQANPAPPPPPISRPQPLPPSGGTNWMPILAGVGGVIALLLVVVVMKMPSAGSNGSSALASPAIPDTSSQTDAAILDLQKQNTLQDAQRQADALKRQAEIEAQQRLAEAQQQADATARQAAIDAQRQAEEAALQAAQDAQRKLEEDNKRAEQTAKDDLVAFFKRYYDALDSSDVSTFESLWDGSASQAPKAIKLLKDRAAKGLRGRGCMINNANLTSLSSSHMRASIYIDATCDRDGNKTDRFRSTFDLEKDGLGQWKLVRQTSN
ncbi:MAG: protein kinase [Gammaproteobacteria bacterium]|nr:protein kinase [Gammaproteobacteria bacterium]MBU1724983.1 protein kinase [Gammaproteobacteria bacterium]MBU2007093.1 protein kinase [Gammaproteobacteria bacterium]